LVGFEGLRLARDLRRGLSGFQLYFSGWLFVVGVVVVEDAFDILAALPEP
jgi:hypothetical protein